MTNKCKKADEQLLKNLIEKHINDLCEKRDSVYIKPLGKSITFNTNEIDKNKEKIMNIEKNPYVIYIIKTNEKLTLQDAKDGYECLRSNGCGAFRLNKEKEDNHFKYWEGESGEKCLYVGSSQDIRKRLKEHLGITGKSEKLIGKTTYALHLSVWYKDKNITVELYEVKNEEEMQLYEDLLWKEYKPLLGRQGRK